MFRSLLQFRVYKTLVATWQWWTLSSFLKICRWLQLTLITAMSLDLTGHLMKQLVKNIQEEYEEGAATPDVVVEKLKTVMEVVKVTEKEIAEVMKRCETDNEGYIICLLTAAALASAYSYENIEKYNVVVYGAASPAKFADVLEKVNVKWTSQDLLKELSAKESSYTDWEENNNWSEKLLALLETIDQRVKTTF